MTGIITFVFILVGAFYEKYARKEKKTIVHVMGILVGLVVTFSGEIAANITGMDWGTADTIALIFGIVYIVWAFQGIKRVSWK